MNNPTKYKVFIGRGNNSLLLKSLMKRRFWWEITDSFETTGIHFYWSQNLIEKVEALQQRANKEQAIISKASKKKNKID